MRFEVGPVWTTIHDADPIEVRVLYDLLSFKDPDPRFDDAYKAGEWDGIHRLLFQPGDFDWNAEGEASLWSGWIGAVLRRLESEGLEVEVTGLTEPVDVVEVSANILPGITLRPYQLTTVKKILRYRRGIVGVATGGGKTEMASAALKALDENGLITYGTYVCSTRAAMEQTAKRLDRYGITVGRLGGGYKEWRDVKDGGVMVGVVNSFARMSQQVVTWLEKSDVLVLDEAHHTGARTWANVAMATEAEWRIGLSGTPFRSLKGSLSTALGGAEADWPDLALVGLTGPLLSNIPSRYLQKKGWLARPKVFIIPSRSVGVHLSPNNTYYPAVYSKGIVGNRHRNALIAGSAMQLWLEGHKIIVFVRVIEHGEKLLKACQRRGMRRLEMHIGGGQVIDPESGVYHERPSDILKRLEETDNWCVIATPVYDEAVDLPSVTALVMAAGGKSSIQTLQRVGRVLRPGDGPEKKVVVVDFDDSIHPFLKSHSNKRRALYEEQEFQISDRLVENGLDLRPQSLMI